MGVLDALLPFVTAKAEAACDACSKSFQEAWSRFNQRPVEQLQPVQVQTQVPEPSPLPTFVPAAKRLIAIGDIHGDYAKALRAFKLAGLIDEQGKWSGGDTVAVQVGDILDRGDHEIRILIFLERLQREAEEAGGRLYLLNGNHETMNVMGDHRYCTKGANHEIMAFQTWRDFNTIMKRHSGCASEPDPVAERLAHAASTTGRMNQLRPYNWLRSQALRPGSELTRRFFATRPIVLQVGSVLFVHGGVLPAHVEYGLERINSETQEWMHGASGSASTSSSSGGGGLGAAAAAVTAVASSAAEGSAGAAPPTASIASSSSGAGTSPPAPPAPAPVAPLQTMTQAARRTPAFLRGSTAIVWARNFSAEDEHRCDCAMLQGVLQSIPGAQRMVVGHTIQEVGINAACNEQVIRVDTGMSHGCGDGPVEVLEVLNDQHVRRLREGAPPVDIGRVPEPPKQETFLHLLARVMANAARTA